MWSGIGAGAGVGVGVFFAGVGSGVGVAKNDRLRRPQSVALPQSAEVIRHENNRSGLLHF